MEVVNAKTLRKDLGKILERARKGERFTIVYRSRPVCQLVPLDEWAVEPGDLDEESLFGAEAVGASTDGGSASDHDDVLYGRRRP